MATANLPTKDEMETSSMWKGETGQNCGAFWQGILK